ncbi:MAG: sigma 54-interacting transcriptional regulator [Acidobacteriota bacterium]
MITENVLEAPEAGPLARLLAASPSLEDTLRTAARAARTEAPVLILGPSGSGRTTLARAIHQASPRRSAALVELDPGSVPATLLESDLFGHAAGAFTGAERAHPGRVQRAQGGSLLLDPVESLSLSAQPKLLRLLSEHRYAPLGGEERRADVRFLAAGSSDLPQRCAAGSFRQDLFYRLAVMVIHLPPLVQRRQDLPFLLDALLEDLGDRYGRGDLRLSSGAQRWMLRHPWPGNLRQVRNVLERAVVLSGGDRLDPSPPAATGEAAPQTLEEVERQHILRTLAYTRGHQGRAAEVLGISRKALWAKRKRLGIP